MVRMYGRRSRGGGEEWLDSPFASLELIEPVPGQGRRWRFGSGRMLEPTIVAYAALDCLRRWETSAKTVSVARLAAAPGGPGRAFRLTESELASALGAASLEISGLAVAAPAGLTQLVATRDVDRGTGTCPLSCCAKALVDRFRNQSPLGRSLRGRPTWSGTSLSRLTTTCPQLAHSTVFAVGRGAWWLTLPRARGRSPGHTGRENPASPSFSPGLLRPAKTPPGSGQMNWFMRSTRTSANSSRTLAT